MVFESGAGIRGAEQLHPDDDDDDEFHFQISFGLGPSTQRDD